MFQNGICAQYIVLLWRKTAAELSITDDDMFRMRLNIKESKRAELTMSAMDRTTDRITESSGNIANVLDDLVAELTERQRLIVKRFILTGSKNVLENVLETSASLAEYFHVNERTIRRDLKVLQSKGIIRRIGPDNGGHWEIIEK